ncbi:MAG: ABC transporter substrate-binding protein [Rhodospirillales bacterium]|nr:ABC transporter substrate-binding protein [Rhodospirillales bacterium]
MLGRPMHFLVAFLLATGFMVESALAESVFRLGREADAKALDPPLTIENLDIWTMNNINAYLVRATKHADDIEPDLATHWEISEDGLTYTFHLREAMFSDGSPVTAQDAKFSIERARDHELATQAALYQNIASVETPDDRTVVFTLNEPSAPFLSILAMFPASILPQAVVEERGEEFGSNPVGAGAFRLKEWRRGEVIVLERNPHYWEEGLPLVDRVEWHVVSEDNTRILKVQAGELDGALFVPFNRIAGLEANPDIRMILDPSSKTDHLLPNHAAPPLDNLNVRKAIRLAIDSQAIIDVVTFGYATPANTFLSAGMMHHDGDAPLPAYDPEEARAMLEAEGATGTTLGLTIQAGNRVDEQISVLLQQQLAEVGITIDIRKVDPSQWINYLIEGDYELGTVYWTNDIIDPDQKTAFTLIGDDNRNFFSNWTSPPEVTELVKQARVEQDFENRSALYAALQMIANDNEVLYSLYNSPFRNIARACVKGFFQSPLGRVDLEHVDMSGC